MEQYRTSAHTRFDLKYHFVWITKYRKAILGGPVGLRLRELVVEICKANDVEILQGHISKDHVHLFVSVPPHLAPSKLMQYIKGKTSRKLAMEYRHIQKAFWGRHIWARGYFVASSGNVTDEVIREYIRLQETGEPADGGANFRVVRSKSPRLQARVVYLRTRTSSSRTNRRAWRRSPSNTRRNRRSSSGCAPSGARRS